MPKSATYQAIGAADPVGTGCGWFYIAYSGPDGRKVAAECDAHNRIARFFPIPEEVALVPIPEGQVAEGVIGQVAPMAFVLNDGRVFTGTEEELVPQLLPVLRSDPEQFGALTAPQIARLCGDMEMVAETIRRAAALMDARTGDGGAFWRTQKLCAAYREAFLAGHPDASGDKHSGPVGDLWVHVENNRFWICLPEALWAAVGADGIACPIADAISSGLDYTRVAFVDGGTHPHRWRPAPAAGFLQRRG